MVLTLSDAKTVELHQKLVSAALREVFGLRLIGGCPAEKVVENYYSKLSPRVRLVVAHDDPLGLAFELAGDDAPRSAGKRHRAKFSVIRKRILDAELHHVGHQRRPARLP
jgi:hypothetical protein